LNFFFKGPKSIGFRGDCAYQFPKSNKTTKGFSFMNSISGDSDDQLLHRVGWWWTNFKNPAKISVVFHAKLCTVQKWQCVLYVWYLSCSVNVFFMWWTLTYCSMTDTVSIPSFLADFYALSTSASLEYAISSVAQIPAFSMYSSDADVDNA
jgi:hypothetical protein